MKRKKKNETDLATREKDKFETIYILEQHEIGSQRLKLVSINRQSPVKSPDMKTFKYFICCNFPYSLSLTLSFGLSCSEKVCVYILQLIFGKTKNFCSVQVTNVVVENCIKMNSIIHLKFLIGFF